MRYENRTDFRALDVLVSAVDAAEPGALIAAVQTCDEQANNFAIAASKRAIWRALGQALSKSAGLGWRE